MAQRWRSKARRDPDLDDDDGSPPSRQPRRGGGSDGEDDDEMGNEDLSLEILAKARRKQRGASGGGVARFADLLSASSGDEEADEDAVVELGEAEESQRKQRKKQRRKQRRKHRKEEAEVAAAKSTAATTAGSEEEKDVGGSQEGPIGTTESVLTEDGADADADVPSPDNMVLRKLLRIPRYFDPGETLVDTCFNCNEEGHVAANCPMEKRKKPCFVCGLFGHNAKQCTQGQDCFICKKGGHVAKDCPDKYKRTDRQSSLCLRCGEIGHDMFGCTNEYPPDDINQIRCYVCNQNGHLCCFDSSDNCPKQISCYNCAKSGHSGLGCAKQRRETSAVMTPTECYKCGEEGHFARGCTKNAKSDRSKGKSSSHNWRKEKWKKDSSARSAPPNARKTSKRKSPHFDDKMDTPRHKSKARGGWSGGDDLDDLPFKKYKSNGWASPSTPKKTYTNHQFSSGGDYFTPQSPRRHKKGYASPNSNYSPSSKKNGFSSSRFAASNTHLRFERS